MPEARCFGSIRNVATIATMTLFLGGCLMQEPVEDTADEAAIEADYELFGSVGDGPVVGAAMRVMRNDGEVLSEFQSDASAGYNVSIRAKGSYYPLILDAIGGMDIVTDQAPDFMLIGAALERSSRYVANVNPFSTLVMEIARDLPGGHTKDNIYAAQDIALASMNFGLMALTRKGPMTAEVDSGNVAEIVKSSEALGEVVRRTRDWLLTAGYVWNGDDVMRALGSDLVDGVIDGIGGPRVNARLAAIANIVVAQVLLESMANELHVNGADATAQLEMAIEKLTVGSASPAMGELTATSEMLAQTEVGLAAADAISDDSLVTDLRQSVAVFQPGLEPTLARSVLPQDYRQTLDNVLQLIISGDAATIATVNDVARNDGAISDNDPPPPIDPPPVDPPPVNNTPPAIAGTPPPVVTANTLYDFTPIASDADNDTLTYTFAGLPAWVTTADANSGHISGTPGDGYVGNYNGIVITVSDGTDTADLGPFSVSVEAISMGSATLNWLPPTQNEDGTQLMDLAGYRIYWGPPGNHANSVTINNPGLTSYVVDNLAPGNYEFVATAFNAAGMESNFSNSAMKTIQ